MPLPQSVVHKLGYAKLHLDTLDIEIERYLDGPIDTLRNETAIDSNFRVIVVPGDEVPGIIRLRCGDVLQNLRSTLDYLVWELVLAAKDQPTKKQAFPVCNSSYTAFKKEAKTKLDGVPVAAIEIIEKMQPYHFPREQRQQSIVFMLDELTNINKHRSILLARKRTVPTELIAIRDRVGTVVAFDARRATDDQASTELIAEAIKMNVDMEIAIFVQFDEGPAKGHEVVSLLTALIAEVRINILARFEEFFV